MCVRVMTRNQLEVLVKTTSRRIGSDDDTRGPSSTLADGPAESKLPQYVRPYTYHHYEDPKRPFDPEVMGYRYYGQQPVYGAPIPTQEIPAGIFSSLRNLSLQFVLSWLHQERQDREKKELG